MGVKAVTLPSVTKFKSFLEFAKDLGGKMEKEQEQLRSEYRKAVSDLAKTTTTFGKPK